MERYGEFALIATLIVVAIILAITAVSPQLTDLANSIREGTGL